MMKGGLIRNIYEHLINKEEVHVNQGAMLLFNLAFLLQKMTLLIYKSFIYINCDFNINKMKMENKIK
jgi:hypothetical protein